MPLKNLTLSLMVSLLFLPALAGRAHAQTADEVVEKHLAAIGGREALGKLTTRRLTGTITISTANGDLPTSPAEISIKAPNKSRQVMTLDVSALGGPANLVIQQLFNGTTAWSLDSANGDTEITGNRLDNLRNNIFPTPLLTYKTAGTKLELLPKEKVSGKDAIVLQATPKAGSVSKLYLDAETYLLLRSVATVDIPAAGGPVQQTGDYSDYRVVDGVRVAFQLTNSNPAQTATIKFTKVEHNVPLDDAIFNVKK